MVGPLAQGRRQRRHGRPHAAGPGCRTACRPSTSYEERPGRWVGEPHLAVAARPARVTHPLTRHRIGYPSAGTRHGMRATAARARAGDDGAFAAVRRPVRGQVGLLQRAPRPALRPARGGRRLARLRHRAADRARWRSSAHRPWNSTSRPTSRSLWWPRACPTSAPTAPPPASRTACSTSPGGTSAENPEALEPGRRYRATVQLNGVAQAFPPGHRIRLSLSTSYWPLAWPPPKPALLSVYEGSSTLTLPVRPMDEPDEVAVAALRGARGNAPDWPRPS